MDLTKINPWIAGPALIIAGLKTQPTDTTTATIAGIQVRHGRNSTSYYAIFEYTVGGKLIDHPRYEDKGDFSTGDKYEIRYSVKYPEMFKIVGKWQYNTTDH
jgi:hypothetical protein